MKGNMKICMALALLVSMQGTAAVKCYFCIYSNDTNIPDILKPLFPNGVQQWCEDPFLDAAGTENTCEADMCMTEAETIVYYGTMYNIIKRGCGSCDNKIIGNDISLQTQRTCCNKDYCNCSKNYCNTASPVISVNAAIACICLFMNRMFI